MTESETAYFEAYKRENTRAMIFALVSFALLVLFACWHIWDTKRQPIRERAAYLQGYYGIDADTAWEMALQGHGKTAEEVSQGK